MSKGLFPAISQKKLDLFKSQMSNEGIHDNPNIKQYTQRMERLAEKKSGIPTDKIRHCRRAV